MEESKVKVINMNAIHSAINDIDMEVEMLSEARRTADILLDAMWDDFQSCCENGTKVEHSQMENLHDAFHLVLTAYWNSENNIRKYLDGAFDALGYTTNPDYRK